MIRHDADHLVVKAAFHALARRHHPDQGGDTVTMQKVNAAHDYMSTRSQAARLAEWERVKAEPRQKEEAARKAAASSSHDPAPPAGSTTRPWKPVVLTPRQKFEVWRYRQPLIVRWLLSLSRFLLILSGRLAMVAAMFYAYAEAVRWGIKALAHGAWVLLIIFPGTVIAGAGFMVTGIFAINFLLGGWKGISDFLMDRRHEGLTPDPNAWTRKTP
ncbi:hypothetical protein [Acidithiobacillus sp.]